MSDSIDRVTDVFAFALKHGVFTETIFESEYPQHLGEAEITALDAAWAHISAFAHALLRTIDAAILADPLPGSKVAGGKKRDATLESWWLERWMAQFGNVWLFVAIRQQESEPDKYALKLGLWFRQAEKNWVEEAVVGHLEERHKKYVVTAVESELEEGKKFDQLAEWCVKEAKVVVGLLDAASKKSISNSN
ncbi:MAG: hypothetical protein K8I27_06800 [Planctomycetes bacterium]|nr:hypothetical protein [Planctomycetota bacterium]